MSDKDTCLKDPIFTRKIDRHSGKMCHLQHAMNGILHIVSMLSISGQYTYEYVKHAVIITYDHDEIR